MNILYPYWTLCVFSALFPIYTGVCVSSGQLNEEVLGGKEWSYLNVDLDILCLWILVDFKIRVLLDDASGAFIITKEIMNVLCYLRLDGRSPYLHGMVIAIVLKNLSYPIEYPDNGIFLQTFGGTVVQCMVGEGHGASVLFYHRNHAKVNQGRYFGLP